MDVSELFGANLALIERVARGVCWRRHLRGPDVEDFVSAAKLALLENDYAILRRFEGRSSLPTFLAVVFHRLLADQAVRAHGRWNASREAERMGAAGVLLERLLVRERRPFDEVLPFVLALDPALTRDAVAAMAARLPQRAPRPRSVPIDEAEAATAYASPETADASLAESEARALSDRVNAIMRDVLGTMSLEDRTLIRMRYGMDMSIADVSRMMRLPQRGLYKRFDALLLRLRKTLLGAGVQPDAVAGIIGAAASELDFDLGDSAGGAAVAEQSS